MVEAQFNQLANSTHANAWADSLLMQINFKGPWSTRVAIATCNLHQMQ
jgi:hypothetical protein